MKYEQYLSLIQELEVYAEKSPRMYRYKVSALAALGYLYIIGLILLFLSLPALLILLLILAPNAIVRIFFELIKLWWLILPGLGIFFGFLGGAIKALWSKIPEPPGIELDKNASPELRSFINDTCKALKAQKPAKILISDEFNAAVITLPRFGLFGRKVYLMLGLPLMRGISPEQFEAVIAHEIGHISGRHGGFAKWAYQLRDTWGRFIEAQELQEHRLAALYKKFVDWFFPYFTAYSFVLMRGHEREADAYVVRSIGSKALGEALITLEATGNSINTTFWDEVNAENRAGKDMSGNMFGRMLDFVATRDDREDMEVVAKALEVPTDYTDSHPSLADRLKHIGYWNGEGMPNIPTKPVKSAEEHFLKGVTEDFIKQFDLEWDTNIAEKWKIAREYNQKNADRLAELEEKSSAGELTAEELYEKAAIIGEREGNAAAMPVLREILASFPEHVDAHYVLGNLLLNADDETGFSFLNKAEELDPHYRLGVNEAVFNYLRRKGRYEEAKPYAAIMEEQYETVQKAEADRNAVNPADEFEASGKPPGELEPIWKKLEFFKEIRALYLVKKVLKMYPEPPVFVLFLDLNDPRRGGEDVVLDADEMQKIAANRLYNSDIAFIIPMVRAFDSIREKLDKIDGALIYKR
jgi:Zn-dependent protease with chaperone function